MKTNASWNTFYTKIVAIKFLYISSVLVSISVGYTYFVPEKYDHVATLILADLPLQQSAVSIKGPTPLSLAKGIILSYAAAKPVMSKFNLHSYDEFRNKVAVVSNDETNQISLILNSANTSEAISFLREYQKSVDALLYNLNSIQLKKKARGLEVAIGEAKKSRNEVEKEYIKSLSRKDQFPGIMGTSSYIESRKNLEQIETSLIGLKEKEKSIKLSSLESIQSGSSLDPIDFKQLSIVMDLMLGVKRKIDVLEVFASSENPELLSLRKEFDLLERNVKTEKTKAIKSVLSSSTYSLARIHSEIGELSARKAYLQNRILELPQVDLPLSDLSSRLEVMRDSEVMLQSEFIKSKSESLTGVIKWNWIEDPEKRQPPTNKKFLRMILISLILSIAVIFVLNSREKNGINNFKE